MAKWNHVPEIDSYSAQLSGLFEFGSSLRTWARGPETVNIVRTRPGPHPLIPLEGRKVEPSPFLLWHPGRPAVLAEQVYSQQEASVFLSSIFFSLFFLPPSEIIRCGVMKGPGTDQKG